MGKGFKIKWYDNTALRFKTIESELIAREAIKRVEALSHTSDLTEKIKDFLEQAKSKQK